MKKKVLIIVSIVVAVIIAIIIGMIVYYNFSLTPMSNEDSEKVVTISKGSTSSQIATSLKEAGLIRNEMTFKLYVKLNKITGMQAGTYKMNLNMSVADMISSLQGGSTYNPDTINITFLEGKNMRWIAKTIAKNTNNTEDQVYQKLSDTTYINSLIKKYWFITNEVENSDIYYSLEGYLFPDTYNFTNKDVTVETIFGTMLDEMQTKLAPYKTIIQSSNMSVHKILTVASIVELEASNTADRAGVASVIYNRIKANMSIGSDVTTYYAIKVDMAERDLKQSEINKENPYNTRGPNMQGKLPVGPISTVGLESINAAINPDTTDYLFFVADKNGKVYYAKTEAEHEANIAKLKQAGLWFTY